MRADVNQPCFLSGGSWRRSLRKASSLAAISVSVRPAAASRRETRIRMSCSLVAKNSIRLIVATTYCGFGEHELQPSKTKDND